MKKPARAFALGIIVCFAVLCAGCTVTSFSGTSSVTEERVYLEYSVFTGAKSLQVRLEAGQQLRFSVESRKGAVGAQVRMQGEQAVYESDSIADGSFVVDVPKTGVYTITLVGKKAKGSIEILIEDTGVSGNDSSYFCHSSCYVAVTPFWA